MLPVKNAPKNSQGFVLAMVHPHNIAKSQFITYPFSNDVEKGKVFAGHFEFVAGMFKLYINGNVVDHWTSAYWCEVMDLLVTDYMTKNFRIEGWSIIVPHDFLKHPVVGLISWESPRLMS